jgi:hypothetical protein
MEESKMKKIILKKRTLVLAVFTASVIATLSPRYFVVGDINFNNISYKNTRTMDKIIKFENTIVQAGISSIEEFGAIGDGLTDDTAALTKALNSGKKVFLKDNGKYRITKRITVDSKNVFLICEGKAEIIFDFDDTGFLTTVKPKKTTKTVSEGLTIGKDSITLEDTVGIEKGDIVYMSSDEPWYYDPRPNENGSYDTLKGEMHYVKEIKDNKLILDGEVNDNYKSEVDVSIYKPYSYNIENISFKYSKPTYKTMVSVNFMYKPTIKNSNFGNSTARALYISKCVEANIDNNTFIGNCPKDVSTGYGVQDYGSIYTKISNNTFTNFRRGIDFSGNIPSRFGTATNNKVYSISNDGTFASDWSGIGTHGGAENIIIENNKVVGTDIAYLSRGTNVTIRNNSAERISKFYVKTAFGGVVNILNNTFEVNKNSIIPINFLRIDVSQRDDSIINVKGNTCIIKGDFIRNDSKANNIHTANNRISK